MRDFADFAVPVCTIATAALLFAFGIAAIFEWTADRTVARCMTACGGPPVTLDDGECRCGADR